MKKIKRQTRSTENTKAALIDAAKGLFARQGFYGTTVQEIAKAAKINISMISHHFGGKEGLYRECLMGFGEARLEALSKFLETPNSLPEFRVRVEMLISELFVFHLKHSDVTAILLRDVNAQKIWGKKLESTLFSFTLKLAQFFGEAKEKEFIKENIDPLTLTALIYFACAGLIQNSGEIEKNLGVSLSDQSFRKDVIEKMLSIVWGGILPH